MALDTPTEDRYGAEGSGLLCGYVFEPGQVGRPIDADTGCETLTGLAEPGEAAFVWLHFNLANQASLRWLRQRLSLPLEFYESLEQRSSTRVEVVPVGLVAVLNDVTMFGVESYDVSSMSVAVRGNLLVSARHTPLRSVDRLRSHVRSGETFGSALGLFAHLLRDQADVLARLAAEVVLRVDAIEDQSLAGRIGSSRAQLGSLRRTLVRLRRLLAPEPAALFRLLHHPAEWMDRDDVERLRQSAEELAAAVADCAALIERIRLLQEEVLATINEQTNRTLFLLTVVTVATLPMTIISGLFGMNVGGVPLGQHRHGFWIVLAVMVGMAGAGAWLVLRRRGTS
jgi:zinc transporter